MEIKKLKIYEIYDNPAKPDHLPLIFNFAAPKKILEPIPKNR